MSRIEKDCRQLPQFLGRDRGGRSTQFHLRTAGQILVPESPPFVNGIKELSTTDASSLSATTPSPDDADVHRQHRFSHFS